MLMISFYTSLSGTLGIVLCYKMTSHPYEAGWPTTILSLILPNAAILSFLENLSQRSPHQNYVSETITPLPDLVTTNIFSHLTYLAWSLHVSNVCKKTRKHIGILYRNFYQYADSLTLLKLYTTLVWPHTEYACIIWALTLQRMS